MNAVNNQCIKSVHVGNSVVYLLLIYKFIHATCVHYTMFNILNTHKNLLCTGLCTFLIYIYIYIYIYINIYIYVYIYKYIYIYIYVCVCIYNI